MFFTGDETDSQNQTMNRKSLFDEGLTLEKLDQYRRNNSDDGTSAKTSSTYADLVEEVERASEIIVKTQRMLFKAQEEARISSQSVKRLEERLNNQNKELVRLHGENSLLMDEGQELRDNIHSLEEEAKERDAGNSRPVLEQRLRKAVELLRKDLESSKQKQEAAEDNARNQKGVVDKLEASNKNLKGFLDKMEKKDKESLDKFEICKSQLLQATEESTKMIEEVAELREELKRTKKIAEQKDAIIRREVTESVKEKIRLEVREAVTRQVTEKVSRQMRVQMKAERENEINTLREQFKKTFKENEQLKEKVSQAEAAVAKSKKLEEVIPNLKYEISRLLSTLDNVKRDQELAVSQLETRYRKQMQTMKEEAAKEKWANATEIRKQLSIERDREVNEFTERIEALSRQTDRLLQQAEKEKEVYANHVKQRAIEGKNREIEVLKEQLALRTREGDELLLEAAHDKETYGEQIRQHVEEEKRRDSHKYSYRIEVLATEKENLQKRIDSFEEELTWAWKEHEEKSEQLKESQADAKILEDDIFKLKRKNQNLNTLVERYKQDYDEVSAEFSKSKKEFEEELLRSQQQSHSLKERLKQAQSMLCEIRNLSVDADDHSMHSLLVQRTILFEEEITRLRREKDTLSASVSQLEHERNEIPQSELQAENERLREKVDKLTSLVHSLRREILEIEMVRLTDETLPDPERKGEIKMDQESKESAAAQTTKESAQGAHLPTTNSPSGEKDLNELKAENKVLKRRVDELNASLEDYKKKYERSSSEINRTSQEYLFALKTSQEEIDSLKTQLKSSNKLGSPNRLDKSDSIKKFDASKLAVEDLQTVVSEDDTAQLNNEIQALERLVDGYKVANAKLQSEDDAPRADPKHATEGTAAKTKTKEQLDATCSPQVDARHLNGEPSDVLVPLAPQHPRSPQSLPKSSVGTANSRSMTDLSSVVEKYDIQISQLSQELEHTKERLTSEHEETSRLRKRIRSLNLQLQSTEAKRLNSSPGNLESTRTSELSDTTAATDEEIARLKQVIEELNQKIGKRQLHFDNSMENANKAREKLENELSTLASQHIEAQNRANRFQAELEKFFDSQNKTQKRANQLETELEKFLTADGDDKKRADRLEVELQAFIAKYEEAQRQVDDFKNQIQRIRDEDGEAAKIVDTLEIQLQASKAKHREVTIRADRLEAEFQKAASEGDEARKQVKHLEIKLLDLTARHAEAQRQVDRLILDKQNSAPEGSGGQAEASQLETDIEKLRAEHGEVSKELKHSKRLFKEELLKSEHEIFDLQKRLEETRALVEKNQQDHDLSAKELLESKRQLEVALVTSETHARSKAMELETLLSRTRSENATLREQLRGLEQRIHDKSHPENQKLRDSIENLQSLLDESRRENERTKEDLEHSIELFKEALAAWRDESKSLNEELRTLRQSSAHSRTTTSMGGSQHSRDLTVDTSFSQRTTTSSVSQTSEPVAEGRHGVFDFDADETNKSPLSQRTMSSEDSKPLIPEDLRDTEDSESTSSSSRQLQLSLVSKWRRETHQLIEEVEAAHDQRRKGNSGHSGVDPLKATVPPGASQGNNSSSLYIETKFQESKKQVSWKADPSNVAKVPNHEVTNAGENRDQNVGRTKNLQQQQNSLQLSPVGSNALSFAGNSLDSSDHADAASVDSDEALLREKLGNRMEQWNKTLDDFSSILGGDGAVSPSRKKRLGSLEGSASSRSERSILRNNVDVDSSGIKKSVTWTDTVEELSFDPEVGTLTDRPPPQESRTEDGPHTSKISFDHAARARGVSQREDTNPPTQHIIIEEVREPPPEELDIPGDRVESRDEIATPTRTDERIVSPDDFDYSLSHSSHTVTSGLINFKASDIENNRDSQGQINRHDDDSTLDWHLNSAGESSTGSLLLDTSDSSCHIRQYSQGTPLESRDTSSPAHHYQVQQLSENVKHDPSQDGASGTNGDGYVQLDQNPHPDQPTTATTETTPFYEISQANTLSSSSSSSNRSVRASTSETPSGDTNEPQIVHVHENGTVTIVRSRSSSASRSGRSHEDDTAGVNARQAQNVQINSSSSSSSRSGRISQSNANSSSSSHSARTSQSNTPNGGSHEPQVVHVHDNGTVSVVRSRSSSSSRSGRLQADSAEGVNAGQPRSVEPLDNSSSSSSNRSGRASESQPPNGDNRDTQRANVDKNRTVSILDETSSASSRSERVVERVTPSEKEHPAQTVQIPDNGVGNMLSTSSSSSTRSGRALEGRTVSGDTNESRELPPRAVTDSKSKRNSLPLSSSSSASMASSSCYSSFSSSFSSSTSSHSNRAKHVDMTGEVRDGPTTFLVPIGEEAENDGDTVSTKDQQTGNEKTSRGGVSKKKLRRFMKKKRSSRKKLAAKANDSTDEAQTARETAKGGVAKTSKSEPSAISSEAQTLANLDQMAIVAVESKE